MPNITSSLTIRGGEISVYLNSFTWVSSIKLINALSSIANLSLRTTNLEPDNFIDVSKSIPPSFLPRSICDLILKLRFFIFPTFLTNLFSFSFFPIGTSSAAILGRLETISSTLSWVFFCSNKILLNWSEIFLDFSKFDFSLDCESFFFSCSNNSFLFISSLLDLSTLRNSSGLKSKFLSLNFFLKISKFFLNSLRLCIFYFSIFFFSKLNRKYRQFIK